MPQHFKISLKLEPTPGLSRYQDRLNKLLAAVIENYPFVGTANASKDENVKLEVREEILYLKIKKYCQNTKVDISHIMDCIRHSIKIIYRDIDNCLSLMQKHPGPDFKEAVENMGLHCANNVEVDILCSPPFLTDTNLVLWPKENFPLHFLTEEQSSRLTSIIEQEVTDNDDQTLLCVRLLELYKIQDKSKEETLLNIQFVNEPENCIKNTIMFYQTCGGTIQGFNRGLAACLENPGPDLANVANIATKLPKIINNVGQFALNCFVEWMNRFETESVIYTYQEYKDCMERKGLSGIIKTSKNNIRKMIELNIIVLGDGLYLARSSKMLVGDYAHVCVLTDPRSMKVVHASQNSLRKRKYGRIVEDDFDKVVKEDDGCFVVRQNTLTGDLIAARARTFSLSPTIEFVYSVGDSNCEVVFNAASGIFEKESCTLQGCKALEPFASKGKKVAAEFLATLQKNPRDSKLLLNQLYFRLLNYDMLSITERYRQNSSNTEGTGLDARGATSMGPLNQEVNTSHLGAAVGVENKKTETNSPLAENYGHVIVNPTTNIKQGQNLQTNMEVNQYSTINPEGNKIKQTLAKGDTIKIDDEMIKGEEDLQKVDIKHLKVTKSDWETMLSTLDETDIVLGDLKVLAKILLKIEDKQGRKFVKGGKGKTFGDTEVIKDILTQFMKREPSRTTMSIFLEALESGNYHKAQKAIERGKKKKHLSNTTHRHLKQLLDAYRRNIIDSRTMICAIRPITSRDEHFLPQEERELNIVKFHIDRKFEDVDTGVIHETIDSVFENGNRVILTSGPAGMGKSHFLETLLVKWAEGSVLDRYKLAIAFTCRRLTTTGSCSPEELVFDLSSVHQNVEEDDKQELSFKEIEALAREESIVILADGSDELRFPSGKGELDAILAKVRRTRSDKSIQLSPEQIVIGLLQNELIPNARLVVAGRDHSIDEIKNLFYISNLPEININIGEETIKLAKEKVSVAKHVRLLEFSKQNIQDMGHKLLCEDDEEHNEGFRCEKAFREVMKVSETVPLVHVPAIARWALEIAHANIERGQESGFIATNITGIVIELFLGRCREHAHVDSSKVLDFKGLQMNEETKHLAVCLEKSCLIWERSLLKNQIITPGEIIKVDGIELIEAEGVQIKLEDVRRLGLMKINETRRSRFIMLEPEHLLVAEFTMAAKLRVSPTKEIREKLLKLEPGRQMSVFKYASGLCKRESRIVTDFLTLFHEKQEIPDQVLRELQRTILNQAPKKLPDTQDHSSILINGTTVSGRQLGLLAAIWEEAGSTKFKFSAIQKMLDEIKVASESRRNATKQKEELEARDAGEDSDDNSGSDEGSESVTEDEIEEGDDVEEGEEEDKTPNIELEVTRKPGSKRSTGAEYVSTITAKDDVEMRPSDWRSLLFLQRYMAKDVTFVHQIPTIVCLDKVPKDVDKKVVAAILVQANKVQFGGFRGGGFTLENDLLEPLVAALDSSHKLEKVGMLNVKLQADHDLVGHFLSNMKVVTIQFTAVEGRAWEEWGRSHLRKVEDNARVTEEITLDNVNVPAVDEPGVVGGLLSTVPTVALWDRWDRGMKMPKEIWTAWGQQNERRRSEANTGGEAKARLEHLTLGFLEVEDVDAEALGHVVVSVPTVTLWSVENMGDGHWTAIRDQVLHKAEEDTLVLNNFTLAGTDVTSVDPQLVGETLANLATVSIHEGGLGGRVLSTPQWSVFCSQVQQNKDNNKLRLKKFNVEQLNADEEKENAEFINMIKSAIAE